MIVKKKATVILGCIRKGVSSKERAVIASPGEASSVMLYTVVVNQLKKKIN